jgi:hypothetical protein
MVAGSGATLLRLVVASTLVLLVFGESRWAAPWKALFADLTSPPIASRPLLVAHVAATLLFAQLSSILFRVRTTESIDNILALSWIASGVVAAGLAILAFAPARFWLRLLASLRPILAFALIVSIGGYAFGWVTSTLWRPLSSALMFVVYWLLHPLIGGISADPSTLIVGRPDFQVMISRECSGYEGLGLNLVFTTTWLRFPPGLAISTGARADSCRAGDDLHLQLPSHLVSTDFESVGWQSVSWFAILLSSNAFGVLHGDRWLAGTVAGAIDAFIWMRRGSMGDAVAAHATTNALIAAWVLISGQWHLW